MTDIRRLQLDLNEFNAGITRARRAYDEHIPYVEHHNARPLAKCGTPSGYKRHKRAGEKVCDECRAAKRKYDNERYQRTKR